MCSHYPAMHIMGLHIVIVGPGAANNFHAKVINPGLPRTGSAVGRDFMTTEQLPFSSGRPWDFGVDTMVLKVAGPKTSKPWAVTLVYDSLLDGDDAARALARINDYYFSLPVGCGGCDYDRLGCVHCKTREQAVHLILQANAGSMRGAWVLWSLRAAARQNPGGRGTVGGLPPSEGFGVQAFEPHIAYKRRSTRSARRTTSGTPCSTPSSSTASTWTRNGGHCASRLLPSTRSASRKSTGVRDRGEWGDLHREELRDTVYGSEGGMREGGREEGRAHDHHSQRNRGRRR